MAVSADLHSNDSKGWRPEDPIGGQEASKSFMLPKKGRPIRPESSAAAWDTKVKERKTGKKESEIRTRKKRTGGGCPVVSWEKQAEREQGLCGVCKRKPKGGGEGKYKKNRCSKNVGLGG